MTAAICGSLSGCFNQRQPAAVSSNGTLNGSVSSPASSTEPKNDDSTKKTDQTPAKPTDSAIESIYTDLAAEKCRTIESDETGAGSYIGECPGVGGYKLEVLEGDIRQTINVIAPSGKKSELEFWSKISSAFSAVGEKAEWRVKKNGKEIKPLALIVRYNTNEDPEKPEKNTSRLVVIKISGDTACITDIVEPIKDANVKARELADASAGKPCK